jgi:nucleotide-binding universal stress UspA family protein
VQALLVPTDFSSHSGRALDHAIALARALDARVHLLHAVHLPAAAALGEVELLTDDIRPRMRDAAARKLEKARQKVAGAGVEAQTHLEEGSPAEVIVRLAETLSADLIVMGMHGWSGIPHIVLGSTAERVIRTAPCPVMTVREGA